MLFKEIVVVHSENYTKPINTLCGKNAECVTVKADDTPLGFKELRKLWIRQFNCLQTAVCEPFRDREMFQGILYTKITN
jgi:hypothetical protein